jgi:hypothetical protein
MKKFEYDEITDQVFQSTKIDQLIGLSVQVSQTVDMISMLDDGSLMDQLSGAREVVKDLQYTVKRMKEVSGDFHLKTQSQRLRVIEKIAKG